MHELARYKEAAGDLVGTARALAEAIDLAKTMIIESQEDYDFAAGLLRDAKTRAKDLDAKRKAVTDPLLKAKREVDGWFRPSLQALELLEATLKRRMAGWLAEERQRALLAVAAAAEAPTPETAQTVLATAPAAPVQPSGVSVRRVDRWAVEDPAAVPRAYCSPDLALIADALNRGETVPGVRTWTEDQIVARTK